MAKVRRTRLRSWTLLLLLLSLGAMTMAGLTWPTDAAEAQEATPSGAGRLVESLRRLVGESGLSDRVGVSVIDVRNGRTVYEHHAQRPMNPASNMKLVTAAAALRALGPQFHMRTGVYGRVSGGSVTGGLALRGFGDPTLTSGDLMALARAVADQGVVRVDRVIVDGSYFDDQVLPQAFEQQPNEVAAFRAPVSAIALDRNAYTLRVLPGTEVGAPALVRLLGAGYFDLSNRITTSAPGAPNVIADQRAAGAQMRLGLRGTVPVDVRGVSYRRRIVSPLPWAGHAFVDALRAQGIECGPEVTLGTTPRGAPRLASHESPTLAEILPAMGKWSDNFTAEMLFKVMGAERHQPGRAQDGVAAVRAALEGYGLELDPIDVVNGSGLFDGNRISAGALSHLLHAVYSDSAIRSEYLSHLAVGGMEGTLRRRLRDLPAPRIVRAKTGTLNDVIALSGYVLGDDPGSAYAFSFLANGARGRHGPCRALADNIVRELATELYR